MSVTELILIINDIHNLAIAHRLSGGEGNYIHEIEELAENTLERACDDGSHDTEFVTDGQ